MNLNDESSAIYDHQHLHLLGGGSLVVLVLAVVEVVELLVVAVVELLVVLAVSAVILVELLVVPLPVVVELLVVDLALHWLIVVGFQS